jgi:hypothetical protein
MVLQLNNFTPNNTSRLAFRLQWPSGIFFGSRKVCSECINITDSMSLSTLDYEHVFQETGQVWNNNCG